MEEKRSKTRKALSEGSRCPDCDKIFPSRDAVRRHVKRNHGLSKCPFCDESFIKDSHRWPRHLLTYHQNEQENPLYKEILESVEVYEAVCQLCGRKFKQSNGLDFHLKNVHGCQTNTFACDQCGKLLKTPKGLVKHKKTFHEGASKTFLCVECGAVLKSKSSLLQHIERFHSEEKITCTECGRQFKCKKDLVRHVGNLHTARERTFECTQCSQSYFSLCDLKNHVTFVHDIDRANPKPWYCEICSFKASRLGNLNQHRRKVHGTPKPISRIRLLEMIEKNLHPFYTPQDLHLVQNGIN